MSWWKRLDYEGLGCNQVVSELVVFASCSREERTSCRREGKDSHLIEKTGMREEEEGRQGIQKWSAK
jgi:hypothetical protein